MIGVPSSFASGVGPRLSVLNDHATWSRLKLVASIWSSGEYLLPLRSAVYIGHSPFLVLGMELAVWPDILATGTETSSIKNTRERTVRVVFPIIAFSGFKRMFVVNCLRPG